MNFEQLFEKWKEYIIIRISAELANCKTQLAFYERDEYDDSGRDPALDYSDEFQNRKNLVEAKMEGLGKAVEIVANFKIQ